jgi:hypothetical protein
MCQQWHRWRLFRPFSRRKIGTVFQCRKPLRVLIKKGVRHVTAPALASPIGVLGQEMDLAEDILMKLHAALMLPVKVYPTEVSLWLHANQMAKVSGRTALLPDALQSNTAVARERTDMNTISCDSSTLEEQYGFKLAGLRKRVSVPRVEGGVL